MPTFSFLDPEQNTSLSPTKHFHRGLLGVASLICTLSIPVYLIFATVAYSGCTTKPKPVARPAATPAQASTAPRTRPALPPKALLKLDDIKPPIAQPVNPAESADRKLTKRVADMLTEAQANVASRQYVAAIRRLERAAALAPHNGRIRRELGLAYAALPNRGKALANLRPTAKAAPDDLQVQMLLGVLIQAQGRRDEAITAFRTALKCSQATDDNPMAAEVLWRLGILLERNGYYTAALECYRRLSDNLGKYARRCAARITLRPLVLRPEVLLGRRGELLLRLGDADRAVDLLARSYRRDRTRPVAAKLLIEALLAARQPDKAHEALLEMTAEPALVSLVPELAETLCSASTDKKLPLRLWKACRARGRTSPPLAVVLARSANAHGATDDAIAILQSIRAQAPDDAAVNALLGKLYVRGKSSEDTLRLLANFLATDETAIPIVHATLARLAERNLDVKFERRFAADVEAAEKPPLYALLFVAGELARLRGKMPLAVALFDKTLSARNDFLPAYQAAADIYLARKRYDRIDTLARRLDAIKGARPLGLFISAKSYIAQGQPGKAAKCLREARQLNSTHLPTLLLLAKACSRTRRLPEAIEAARAAAKLAPADTSVQKLLFDLYVLHYERTRSSISLRRAWAVAGKLLAANSRGVVGRTMRARLHLLKKEYDKAGKILSGLRTDAPADIDVELLSIRLAVISHHETLSPKELDSLAGRLRKVLAARPTSIAATRLLDLLLTEAGKQDEIVSVWGLLYRARPGDVEVARKYVDVLKKARKYSHAADVLGRLVGNDPENTHIRLELVLLLQKAKRYDDAATHGRAGLRYVQTPEMTGMFRNVLLEIYKKARMYDQAQELLDDWIITVSDKQLKIFLRMNKIHLYAEAKQIEKAEQYALSWIKQSPEFLDARKVLIGALVEAGRYTKADKYVSDWRAKMARRADGPKPQPENAGEIAAWCRRTTVYLQMMRGKHAQALKQVEVLLRDSPTDTDLITLKSSCLSELGRPDEALAEMERAYRLDSDDAGINNNLGYMYADLGIHLDKSERMIRTALADSPGVTACMDSLGWVFYKQGRFVNAAREMDLILKRDDLDRFSHPGIFDHAGDIFFRLGKKDKAVRLWRRAIEQADKVKIPTLELRQLLAKTPDKIKAVRDGKTPAVAPLGKGVSEPQSPADKPKTPTGKHKTPNTNR